MRVDIRTRRPILHNNTGGLSGPAVFPVAVRMVHEAYRRVRVPVVGMGGISTWEDAAEMMIAGAAAVQVGAANFRDPFAMPKIIDGLAAFAQSQKLSSITELTGTCRNGHEECRGPSVWTGHFRFLSEIDTGYVKKSRWDAIPGMNTKRLSRKV